ncbi:MAG: hypothetical protein ACI8Z1_001341 [Candidatus Azotimanducaceae bacterium]|jgi:hypothetical protein
MKHAILFSLGFILSLSAIADSGIGPDVELVCPCSYESGSSSSATARVGFVNRGSTATGELVLRVYAHVEEHFSESENVQRLTDIPITSSLAADSEIAIADFFGSFKPPSTGSYHVTFLLLENFTIIDQTRGKVKTLLNDNVAGNATGSDLYFVEDPSATFQGSTLTVNMTAIGNAGLSAANVNVRIIATSTPRFESSFINLATYSSVTSIAAGGLSTAEVVDFSVSDPGSDFPYWHVLVTNSGFVEVSHTLVTDVAYGTQSFSLTGVDYLTDSDGDGVADDNELLAGTSAASASSTPGTSFIDVLAVYNSSVTSLYNGDPTARIEQLFEVSNKAMSDSNVNIQLRVAGYVELNFSNTLGLSALLGAAENGDGVFSTLAQTRIDSGADLVSVFRNNNNGDLCGLATLGGFPTQGLMSSREHIATSIIDVSTCGDLTMIHEIGHVMGLGHSFKQNESGTFVWARGHGVSSSFTTIMAYPSFFNLFSESPLFANPDVSLCNGSPCGVSITDPESANAAAALEAVRFQVANFMSPMAIDTDNDGVVDEADAFPNDPGEFLDTDSDGMGNNADHDDDGDSIPDGYEMTEGLDPLLNDAGSDMDNDGQTNLEEFLAAPKATQFLQTTSASINDTRIHIVNSSSSAQNFIGTMFRDNGQRMGEWEVSLGASVPAYGRLILSSQDLESLFGIEAWKGPAMLEVRGSDSFELMAKLASPSGLISNTNCVRSDRVLNVEGFNSVNTTFIRFINTTTEPMSNITGTLYDADGVVIGSASSSLLESLAAKSQVWINRNSLATKIGAEWNDEAMLEVAEVSGLQLLNLNFVNSETFFNFSCFENADSGRVYLQTTSTSVNDSLTHIVNTSDVPQFFTGTLFSKDGEQLGDASVVLTTPMVPAKGRVILSSGSFESLLGTSPWKGPAMLQIAGSNSFELMTKLASPSKLVSNTNCVRIDQVHNIEGFDSTDTTYVRFINVGNANLSNVTGTLYDSSGVLIGTANQVLVDSLAPNAAVWRTRDNLSDIFGATWQGEAVLTVEPIADLRLLNLNFVNNETFFNFSCYESS